MNLKTKVAYGQKSRETELLTAALLESLGKFFNFGHLCASNPYRCSIQCHRLILTSSFLRWRLMKVVLVTRTAYQLYILASQLKYRNQSRAHMAFDFLWSAVYFTMSVSQLFVTSKFESIPKVYNNIVNFFTKVGKASRVTRLLRLLVIFMQLLPVTCILTGLAASLFYWVEPRNPRYFYALLSTNTSSTTLWLLCGILEIYLLVVAAIIMYFELFLTILFTLGSLATLRLTALKPRERVVLPGTSIYYILQKRLSKKIILYKQWLIVRASYNETFSPLVSITTLKMMSYHSMAIFISVKLHHVMPLPTVVLFSFYAVAFLVCEVAFYFLLGSIFEQSKKILRNWHRYVGPSDRRLVKLMPVGIKLGGNIKKNTGLFIVLIIYRAARAWMIMFPK